MGAVTIHQGEEVLYSFLERLVHFVGITSTEPYIRTFRTASSEEEEEAVNPSSRDQRIAITKGVKYMWNNLPCKHYPSVSELEEYCERRNLKLEYFCKVKGDIHSPKWEVTVRGASKPSFIYVSDIGVSHSILSRRDRSRRFHFRKQG